MKIRPARALTATIAFACAGIGVAASFTANPVKDATLYEDAAGQVANGSGTGIFAGRVGLTSGGLRRHALVQFDLSSIPSSATVTSVSLTMNMGQGNPPTNVSLHRVSAGWGEGASVAPGNGGGGTPAQANDATWTKRFFGTAQDWTTSGGDFLASPSGTSLIGTLGSCSWSNPGMVTDVQGWVSSPATNFGWLLFGDESIAGTAVRFDSRESTTPGLRPLISVTYTSSTFVDGWQFY